MASTEWAGPGPPGPPDDFDEGHLDAALQNASVSACQPE
jgi:hypothetical protein